MYHYDISGDKKRFVLPYVVSGDRLMATIIDLSKVHNVFKYKLYYSNFPHYQQIFNEINLKHEHWYARVEAIEKRIPYLNTSLISPSELEDLHE